MAKTTITYFPTGNGDTSLIKLTDGLTIITDCNVRGASRDEDDHTSYDVHRHLLEEVRRDEKERPHADAFILSHPDQDHCRGFQNTFHSGDPTTWKKSKDEPNKIIMDELWFSRRIFSNFEEALCPDAEAFRKEADRRIALYKAKSPSRHLPGNRLRIIGYGESEETRGLSEITTVPGNFINLINGSQRSDFEFFVHAPFKQHVDDETCERNNTSIILQANFHFPNAERACLALFGGDAHWDVWKTVLKRSEQATLEWDLLLAPHHCSWSFFNDTPYEEHKTPQPGSLAVLKLHRASAAVIASSKPIKDDDDNPPHFAAATEYKNSVGADHFFCTGKHPNESKPEPIIFRMTACGPVKDESSTTSRVRAAAAVRTTLSTPNIYG